GGRRHAPEFGGRGLDQGARRSYGAVADARHTQPDDRRCGAAVLRRTGCLRPRDCGGLGDAAPRRNRLDASDCRGRRLKPLGRLAHTRGMIEPWTPDDLPEPEALNDPEDDAAEIALIVPTDRGPDE